jgi:hypothetical protein
MLRRNALDPNVQAQVKIAFRELGLQINKLERNYRQHRRKLSRFTPRLSPLLVDTLVVEAKRLRGDLELWYDVINGRRPAGLFSAWIKMDHKLQMTEMELAWEQKAANAIEGGHTEGQRHMTPEAAMKAATMTAHDYLINCTHDLCKTLDIDQEKAGWQERLAPFAPVLAAMIQLAMRDYEAFMRSDTVE